MPKGLILIVDDDQAVRESTARLLRRVDYSVEGFESGDAFLSVEAQLPATCILLDVRMPGTDGIGVLRALRERRWDVPVIILSGHGDIPMAVEAMRLGAFDFLEKPYSPDGLFETIDRAAASHERAVSATSIDPRAAAVVQSLSWRQRQILAGILCGHPNKIIAYELGLSIRTIEAYRAQLLRRLRVRGTAEAVKFAMAAGLDASSFGKPK